MQQWKILCLFLSSIFLAGCAKDYHALQATSDKGVCMDNINLPYQEGWFTAHIDVVGKNLSGLLFIKQLEDDSKRVVFTNEAGLTFFDFAYHADGTFEIKQILPMLNRKVIVNTLKKDFALFLGLPFLKQQQIKRFSVDSEMYHRFTWESGYAYYISSGDCSLQRLEYGSNKKRVVSITYPEPGEIEIKHFTFDMRIQLKVLEK